MQQKGVAEISWKFFYAQKVIKLCFGRSREALLNGGGASSRSGVCGWVAVAKMGILGNSGGGGILLVERGLSWRQHSVAFWLRFTGGGATCWRQQRQWWVMVVAGRSAGRVNGSSSVGFVEQQGGVG